jgi:Holliday junction DNA helicase RuvA
VKISGIGARTALSVLSGLSVAELAQAVTMQDSGRLTKIPGIGKKTGRAPAARAQGQARCGRDVRRRSPSSAARRRRMFSTRLLSLGYSDREAVAAVKTLPEGVAVSDGIRQALKVLAKV